MLSDDIVIVSDHELAILYHDQSVLESHHLAVAIRTLLVSLVTTYCISVQYLIENFYWCDWVIVGQN